MSDAAQVIALYDAIAPRWDALRSATLIEREWMEVFLGLLPANPEMLDLGCGTGRPLAGWLIDQGARVTGVDGAPAMIERARAAHPGQDWHVADMRALPALGPFDGVLAWHSFFHLAPGDQPAMIEGFARLTRPGGALMFTSGTAHGTAIGTLEGRPLHHGSLDTAAYRARLEAAGFAVQRHRVSDPDCGGATVWLARRR